MTNRKGPVFGACMDDRILLVVNNQVSGHAVSVNGGSGTCIRMLNSIVLILCDLFLFFAELFSCDIENRNPESGNRCPTPIPKKKLVPLEEIQNSCSNDRMAQTEDMMSEDDESNVPNTSQSCRKSSQSPIPLTNLKNSCYMNSVVQSLAVFPQFIVSLQKFLNAESHSQPEEQLVPGSQSPKSHHTETPNARFPIITSLVKLFLDYETERRRTGDDTKIPDMRNRLERLKETVGRQSKQFLTDNQQDAGEFFSFLMDAASDEMKKSGKDNLIDMWFAVTVETRMKCRACGHVSDPVVTHNTSTFLAVPEGPVDPCDDVELEKLFAATLVQRDRRDYKCPADGCDGTEGDCTSTVSKLPPILMIQISRISLAGEKMETPIQVDSVLRVRSPNVTSDEDELTAEGEVVQYKLRSVICHIGPSITKGHYYSMTRNHVDDDWYDCDDHEIRRVHLNNVQVDSRENGFCFFFQKEE